MLKVTRLLFVVGLITRNIVAAYSRSAYYVLSLLFANSFKVVS